MNFENIKQINFDALSDFCVSYGCLIDSSSIIYLDKVNLLEMFVERYCVKTIKSVFEEINSNLAKQFNDDISLQNIELINSNNNISEAEIDQNILTIFKNNNISKLSEVDKELLIYSIKFKLPIFTDDGGISLLCKENFLPYRRPTRTWRKADMCPLRRQ